MNSLTSVFISTGTIHKTLNAPRKLEQRMMMAEKTGQKEKKIYAGLLIDPDHVLHNPTDH